MSVELILLVLSCLFFISILVSKAGARFGVPVLLLFLSVGMVFGVDGMGIEFSNFEVAKAVSTFALCIILFSGGLDTKFSEVKPIIKQGVTLATFGVFLTAVFTGFFIWLTTGYLMPDNRLTILESMLLASVMSSTDSASVFAVLRSKGISLKNNLRPLLEFESGSNDPMAYMLTATLIQLILTPVKPGPLYVTFLVLVQLAVGGVSGYLLGKVSVKIMNRINLANDSLYPVLMLTCSLLIFSVTYFLKGNGYLAVYVGGLVMGNSKFIMKRSSTNFFDGFAWLSQITMFLTLGLLVSPRELIPVALPSIIISMFMILLGRPASVFLCLIPFGRSLFLKDKIFVSWVGLKGAVPVIFAILPLVAGVPHARIMFNIVFFITLISLLIQGTSLSHVAKLLGLSDPKEDVTDFKDFNPDFAKEIKSVMSELTVNNNVIKNGNKLLNIDLPDNTLAVMVKRGEKYFVPRGQTELEVGDKLLIITDNEKELEEAFASMGAGEHHKKGN